MDETPYGKQKLPGREGSASKHQQFRMPMPNVAEQMQQKKMGFAQTFGKALGKSGGLGVFIVGGMLVFVYGMGTGITNRRKNKHMAGIGGATNLQNGI